MTKRTKGPEDGNNSKPPESEGKLPNDIIPLTDRIKQKQENIDRLRLEKILNRALNEGRFPVYEHPETELAEMGHILVQQHDDLKKRTHNILQQIQETGEGLKFYKKCQEYFECEEFHVFVKGMLDEVIPPVNIPSATVDEEKLRTTFQRYRKKFQYLYSTQKNPEEFIEDIDKRIVTTLFLINKLSREFQNEISFDIKTKPNERIFSYSSVDPVRLLSLVRKLELMKTAFLDTL
jgi:hypothetical protein